MNSFKSDRYIKRKKLQLKDLLYMGIAGLIIVGSLNSGRATLHKLTEEITKFKTAYAQENPVIKTVTQEKIVEVPVPTPPERDDREIKLEKFLKSKNSPLAPYSEVIVNSADYYGISYTDIISISSIESQYCKQTIPGSHNCWGLGGASNFMYFKTYSESIRYMSKLIGTEYLLNKNQGIQPKYCPTAECSRNWPGVVTNSAKEILETK